MSPVPEGEAKASQTLLQYKSMGVREVRNNSRTPSD